MYIHHFIIYLLRLIGDNTAGYLSIRYRDVMYARCDKPTEDMIKISTKIISICLSSPFHVARYGNVANSPLTGHVLLDSLIYDLHEYEKKSARDR